MSVSSSPTGSPPPTTPEEGDKVDEAIGYILSFCLNSLKELQEDKNSSLSTLIALAVKAIPLWTAGGEGKEFLNMDELESFSTRSSWLLFVAAAVDCVIMSVHLDRLMEFMKVVTNANNAVTPMVDILEAIDHMQDEIVDLNTMVKKLKMIGPAGVYKINARKVELEYQIQKVTREVVELKFNINGKIVELYPPSKAGKFLFRAPEGGGTSVLAIMEDNVCNPSLVDKGFGKGKAGPTVIALLELNGFRVTNEVLNHMRKELAALSVVEDGRKKLFLALSNLAKEWEQEW